MRKVIIISVIFVLFICALAMAAPKAEPTPVGEEKADSLKTVDYGTDLSYTYYPATLGNVLYLDGYLKKKPDKPLKVRAEIIEYITKEGETYCYFSAPAVGVRYLIRKDEKGAFMKVIKYPFPLFGFLIDVTFKPEMAIMNYPLKVGAKWVYDGRAEAILLGFIPMGRNVHSEFEIVEKVKIDTPAGKLDTYHIKVMVTQDGKTTEEKYWYAKGYGYSKAETSGHFAELTGYNIIEEGAIKAQKKLPENEEEYK